MTAITAELHEIYAGGDEIEQLAMAVYLDRRDARLILAFKDESAVLARFARLVGVKPVDVGSDNIITS